MTMRHPMHNSAEELLNPNDIKVTFPVSLNQDFHMACEYYGSMRLCVWRVWCHTTTIPAYETRKEHPSQHTLSLEAISINLS